MFLYVISLLFCSQLALSHPQSCGHNYLQSQRQKEAAEPPPRSLSTDAFFYNATLLAEETRIAAGEDPLFSHVRIALDYQFLNESLISNQTKLDFFKNNLFSSVLAFYHATLKVFPKQKPIIPSQYICGYSTLKVSQDSIANGYNNSDMLIYVIGEYSKANNYIAWASVCQRDPELLGRPMVGLVNVNFYYLDWELTGFDSSFKTLVHELFHFMVFSIDHYSYYVSKEGAILGQSKVVQAVGSRYQIILNDTVSFAQTYYNCSTLQGVWLEDNDPQTIGSHWEDTIYRDEFMSPIDRPNKKISNFSFSLLSASGWYQVDFDNVQDFRFGMGEGCNFTEFACKNTDPVFEEFCSSTDAQGCQDDYRGLGVCSSNQFTNNYCYTVDAFSTTLCTLHLDSDFETIVQDQGGKISDNSYCFLSTMVLPGKSRYYAACYEAYCQFNASNNNYSVVITVGSNNHTCEYSGQNISDSVYEGSLKCPDIDRFCGYYFDDCREGCNNGEGLCSTGNTCHFYKGQGICSDNCSSCLNSTFCLVCDRDTFHVSIQGESKCLATLLCDTGKYFDSEQLICLACDSTCKTCDINATNCTSCNQGDYYSESTCYACSDVDAHCLACEIDANKMFSCLQCDSNRSFINESNYCNNCSDTCLTCNGTTAQSCLSCDPGLYLSENRECLACDSSCLTCNGPSNTNCTSCIATQSLTTNNSCEKLDCSAIFSCVLCEISNNSLVCSQCSDGYYLDSAATCLTCNENCLTCNGSLSTNCLSCASGLYLSSTECFSCDISCKECTGPGNTSADCSICNINYEFNSENVCQQITCDSSCETCTGSSSAACYSCYNGFYLETNSSGSFCTACSSTCSECYAGNPDNCLACVGNLTLVEGVCQNSSEISEKNIGNVTTLGGLGNLTSMISVNTSDLEGVKNYTNTVLNKISSIISINSSNITGNELSTTINLINSLIKLSNTTTNSTNSTNSSWDSSMTQQTLEIIGEIASSFDTIAKTNGDFNETSLDVFLETLSQLRKLNELDTNATESQKTNEQKANEAAHALLNANIYALWRNASKKSVNSSNSLCNYAISVISSSSSLLQSVSLNSLSETTGQASIIIDQTFKNLVSTSDIYAKLVQWTSNPHKYSEISNESNLSSVVSIEFFGMNSQGYSKIPVSNLPNAKSFTLPITKGQSLGTGYYFVCVFFNETSMKWEKSGVSTGTVQSTYGILSCDSSHFTDFAVNFTYNGSSAVIISNNTTTNTTNSTTFGGYLQACGIGLLLICCVFAFV